MKKALDTFLEKTIETDFKKQYPFIEGIKIFKHNNRPVFPYDFIVAFKVNGDILYSRYIVSELTTSNKELKKNLKKSYKEYKEILEDCRVNDKFIYIQYINQLFYEFGIELTNIPINVKKTLKKIPKGGYTKCFDILKNTRKQLKEDGFLLNGKPDPTSKPKQAARQLSLFS